MQKNPAEETMARELCQALGYNFRDKALLTKALTHASYVNEHPEASLGTNERLEFLGDAVLDLVVGDLLMREYPEADEGELSKLRAALVDERGLFEMAQSFNLGKYLFLGKGEEQNNGRNKPSILSGAFEALMGAIYLDGGFQHAYSVIKRFFTPEIKRARARLMESDYKTTLQEYTQSQFKCLPEYRLASESGPPHDKRYKVILLLKDIVISEGYGRSKKEAEQEAAREAYKWLKEREGSL